VGGRWIPFVCPPNTLKGFFANALGVVFWRHLITMNINRSLLEKKDSMWISHSERKGPHAYYFGM
jgi:hypothetical protein